MGIQAPPEEMAGAASGTNNAVARVASLVAIAAVGAIVAAAYDGPGAALSSATQASVDAYRAGMPASAALVAAGGLIALVAIRDPRPSSLAVAS